MVSRFAPAMPSQAYNTYAINAPKRTHRRPATCEEAECAAYLHGWETIVPSDSPQADYIRKDRTRRHIETADWDPGMASFTFKSGQRCFAYTQHTVPNGRPPAYRVLHGDWRGAVLLRKHTSAESWVDDFATHQDRLATTLQRG